MRANRDSFFVYRHAGSGLNHGFPSGFFAEPLSALDRIDVDGACVDDGASPQGCSSDEDRLDQVNGTVLRISFTSLDGVSFIGVNTEEPENWGVLQTGSGYDLRGATTLELRARSPGGLRVQFGVGGAVTGFQDIGPVWTPFAFSLDQDFIDPDTREQVAVDLSEVHILLSVVTTGAEAPQGGTILLDDVRFEPAPDVSDDRLGLPLSTETFGVVPRSQEPIPHDQALANLATVYESSLSLLVLLDRDLGRDREDARALADALAYALENDTTDTLLPSSSGSLGLHGGYSSGDLALFNDQGAAAGLAGQARLATFAVPGDLCAATMGVPSSVCLLLDSGELGSNAFAILGLLAAYDAFGDDSHLDAARKIAQWLVDELQSTSGFGGFVAGIPGLREQDLDIPLGQIKSTESNAVAFAAFSKLAAVERRLDRSAEALSWTSFADHAADFVMRMFDATKGRFRVGAVPASVTDFFCGVSPGAPASDGTERSNDADFLDANTLAVLALAPATRYRGQIDWRRPLDFVLQTFPQSVAAVGRTFDGFGLVAEPLCGMNRPNRGADGVAWEFTAQVVTAQRLIGRLYGEGPFDAQIAELLGELEEAQLAAPFGDGRGLVASTLEQGDALPPIEQCLNTPFQCVPERVGLAATAWAIAAERDVNFVPEPGGIIAPVSAIAALLLLAGAGRQSRVGPARRASQLALQRPSRASRPLGRRCSRAGLLAALIVAPSVQASEVLRGPALTPAPVLGPPVAPSVSLDAFHFKGPHLEPPNSIICETDLPDGGFLLGAEGDDCHEGTEEARAVATLARTERPGFVTVRVRCPEACRKSVRANGHSGALRVRVDGTELWGARCEPSGCDLRALGDEPLFSVRVRGHQTHRIELSASAGIRWPVAAVELEWQEPTRLARGIAYSPFRDCQSPDRQQFPSESEIREDLERIRHRANAIRTYSSVGIGAQVARLAHTLGLRVSAGAWLGRDRAANDREIEALIALAEHVPLESVIVGNEVLLRKDLSERELIRAIERVKSAVDVPVTTAEIGGHLLDHPRLMKALDYYLVHYYAFWDQQPIDAAARYVADRVREFEENAGGKRVVVGETGWPSDGPAKGQAVPSPANQRRFLGEFLTLAHSEEIEFYYFAAFDELWKTGEGGVGQFWGLSSADRRTKYELATVLASDDAAPAGRLPDVGAPAAAYAIRGGATGDVAVFTNYGWQHAFVPSGWAGDTTAIDFDDCVRQGTEWNDRVIRVRYAPGRGAGGPGWAGIWWLPPAVDASGPWDLVSAKDLPDLTDKRRLRFRAWSEHPGAAVKFFMGGVTGDRPGSVREPRFAVGADASGFVRLGTSPAEHFIDLRGLDLSRVLNGFAWVAEAARLEEDLVFYLDDIAYQSGSPPQGARPAEERPDVATYDELPIYVGKTLNARLNLDMGVATSDDRYDWVIDREGEMELRYPPDQYWGAVFITFGKPAEMGKRSHRDLSSYRTLSVDLRGQEGGEMLRIGIKDQEDPDDGRETKLPVRVTAQWQTCRFPLEQFTTADLSQVYVPFEAVFESDSPPQTVFFRNVKYTDEPVKKRSCR